MSNARAKRALDAMTHTHDDHIDDGTKGREERSREDRKVDCLMCGVRRHPSNMCAIPESVEGDLAEYYCQECRWGL